MGGIRWSELKSNLPFTKDINFMNFMTSKYFSVSLAIKKIVPSWIFWKLNNIHESMLFRTFIHCIPNYSSSTPTYYLLHTVKSLIPLLRSLPHLSFNLYNNIFVHLHLFTIFWNRFPLLVALWAFINELYNNTVWP